MSHHLRRLFVVTAFFIGAGLIYQVWRQSQPGYGLFDLLRGKYERLALVGAPGLSESDVPSLAKLSEESMKLSAAVLPAVVSISSGKLHYVPVWRIYGNRLARSFDAKTALALGSGVIIDKQGDVVTNYHVIEQAAEIKINTSDGVRHDAKFIGANENLDVAVLRMVGGGENPALSFANSDEVKTGQMVFAVGNPFGLSGTVTRGIISATQRQLSQDGPGLLQTDTVINPGNSGGPLVNVWGQIVGINVAIYGGGEKGETWSGVGLAIPSNEVKAAVEAIVKAAPSGGVLKAYLGLQFNDSLQMAGMDHGMAVLGAQIVQIEPGSPAARTDIQPGDIVLQFGDQRVDSVEELRTMIAHGKPGVAVSIVVSRGGQLLTRVVTPERK